MEHLRGNARGSQVQQIAQRGMDISRQLDVTAAKVRRPAALKHNIRMGAWALSSLLCCNVTIFLALDQHCRAPLPGLTVMVDAVLTTLRSFIQLTQRKARADGAVFIKRWPILFIEAKNTSLREAKHGIVRKLAKGGVSGIPLSPYVQRTFDANFSQAVAT